MNTSLKPFLRWLSTLFTLSLGLVTQPASHAATNIVLAGEDLQARINAAASGDVMVVQSGAYGGNISINKPLAFVRSGSGDLQILGQVSITASGAVFLSRLRFAEAVQISGGGSVEISECDLLKTLGALDGRISARKTQFADELRLTNTAFFGLRITNGNAIRASSTPGSGTNLFLTQSTLRGPVIAAGYQVHMAYCNALHLSLNDSDGTLVGNVFRFTTESRRLGLHTMATITRSSARLRNNDFKASVQNISHCEGYGFAGIQIDQSEAVLENNHVDVTSGADHECVSPNADGVYIIGESSKVSILSCVIVSFAWPRVDLAFGVRRIPSGQGPLVTVSHCCIDAPNPLANVPSHATLFTNPGLNPDRTLAVASPCRNAGPPDAIYNDRDGTRNDIGFTGGPLYNPSLATTDLPIAFWLDAQPRKILKGVQNTIRIEAAGAAGF